MCTCVLQISVQPPAVWACVFCLNALWASLHGAGLMDEIVCLGAAEPHWVPKCVIVLQIGWHFWVSAGLGWRWGCCIQANPS